MAGTSGGTIEPGNQVAASSGIFATSGRVRKNRPIPATTPMTLTNSASTAASLRHLRGRGADQPQRGQSLFAPGGRQPRRRRDEDRDRDEGTDDRDHDHQDRHQRELGRLRRRIERDDRGRTECLERRRIEADHGDELVRRPKPHVTDRPDDRPDPVAELVGRHGLHERGERRRHDGLTGSGHAIDARRGRWCVGQPRDEDPHERLARVDVDVRPDEQARALGGPALRHDEARAPRRALGALVEGRQERQREQQDRRPDRDRERGQAQADRRSLPPLRASRSPSRITWRPPRSGVRHGR